MSPENLVWHPSSVTRNEREYQPWRGRSSTRFTGKERTP